MVEYEGVRFNRKQWRIVEGLIKTKAFAEGELLNQREGLGEIRFKMGQRTTDYIEVTRQDGNRIEVRCACGPIIIRPNVSNSVYLEVGSF
jgi:hypothetical protein